MTIETHVLMMENGPAESMQFFFDVESRLLLRRITATNTILKLPYVIRTLNVAAYDTMIRRFTEIKIDVTVDDRIFDMPQTTSP